MNPINKKYLALFFPLLVILSFHTAIAAQAAPPSDTFHRTGQVYYSNIEGGFYGIIGDDGIKYQPTKLPQKFKKEGLSIKFDAKVNDNRFSLFQWGKIVDLWNVGEITTTLPKDERGAMYVLLTRMDAFNHKDLVALQQVDKVAQELTKEQFDSWINKYDHYTLHYVDIFSADSSAITGACYYTRELSNGMTMNGNIELAAMNFTIRHTPDGWKLTDSGNLTKPILNNQTDILADIKQKALAKYKTDNLATLLQ